MSKLQLFIVGVDDDVQTVVWEGVPGSVELQDVTGLEGAEGAIVHIGGIEPGGYLGILEVRENVGDIMNRLLPDKPSHKRYDKHINSVPQLCVRLLEVDTQLCKSLRDSSAKQRARPKCYLA